MSLTMLLFLQALSRILSLVKAGRGRGTSPEAHAAILADLNATPAFQTLSSLLIQVIRHQ